MCPSCCSAVKPLLKSSVLDGSSSRLLFHATWSLRQAKTIEQYSFTIAIPNFKPKTYLSPTSQPRDQPATRIAPLTGVCFGTSFVNYSVRLLHSQNIPKQPQNEQILYAYICTAIIARNIYIHTLQICSSCISCNANFNRRSKS